MDPKEQLSETDLLLQFCLSLDKVRLFRRRFMWIKQRIKYMRCLRFIRSTKTYTIGWTLNRGYTSLTTSLISRKTSVT